MGMNSDLAAFLPRSASLRSNQFLMESQSMQSSSPLLVMAQIDLMNCLMSASNSGQDFKAVYPIMWKALEVKPLYDLCKTHGVLNQCISMFPFSRSYRGYYGQILFVGQNQQMDTLECVDA